MAEAGRNGSFYARLRTEVLAHGASRHGWARFVRWLRSPRHGVEPIGGRPVTVGHFILQAWRRERRVPHERVVALASAVAGGLPGDNEGLEQLSCWRGHEVHPRPPTARVPRRLATCRSTLDILRHHLDEDPGGGLRRREALESLRHRYQRTDDDDQRREMALWARPLGKRSALPRACGTPPHPERFDMIWAFPWQAPYTEHGPDDLRDLLGLVSFPQGGPVAELVVFHYARGQAGDVAEPTVIEALGGWAYVPALPGAPQTTYDYRRLEPGAPEFVHAAGVPPLGCRFAWRGAPRRDWRD